MAGGGPQQNNVESFVFLLIIGAVIIFVAVKKKKTKVESNSSNNSRYPALNTIAGIYMASAWIIGIITIIVSLYLLSDDNGEMKMFALIAFIIGGILVLGLAAISESIKVFLDIEYNTRQKKNSE